MPKLKNKTPNVTQFRRILMARVTLIWDNEEAANIARGWTGFCAQTSVQITPQRLFNIGVSDEAIFDLNFADEPNREFEAEEREDLAEALEKHFPKNVLRGTIEEMGSFERLYLDGLWWRER